MGALRALVEELGYGEVRTPWLEYAETLERFGVEIRRAAGLKDPRIAPALISGTTERGMPFYTTAFVAGENLTNTHYSGTVQVDNAASRYFEPSDTRSFYAGLRWTR
jgi:hypothetical protein